MATSKALANQGLRGNISVIEVSLKNVLIIDGAENCIYDIFSFSEEQFAIIFTSGTDVAFIDEVEANNSEETINKAFAGVWNRRVPKREVVGIHGTIFYNLEKKKSYYPTRKDEEATNPDGSKLRAN